MLVSSGPDATAKTAAAPNLFSLWDPRLIPLWIFSILVRFLPESTCFRVNLKPDLGRFVEGWLINDLLDDESAMKHEKMIRKKGSNKEEDEKEEAMVCVCVSGLMRD